MVTFECLKEVTHGVVSILLAHVFVEWKRVTWCMDPRVLVRDTPGIEGFAIWCAKANVEQLVVD